MHANGRITTNAPTNQMTTDGDFVTKKWVEENAPSGGGVEVYSGDTPPAGRDKGSLLMTNSGSLYLYTS